MLKTRTILLVAAMVAAGSLSINAQNPSEGLNSLWRSSEDETRSISPENFTGEKGKGGMARGEQPYVRNENNGAWWARDLGTGWKCSPNVSIKAHETLTIAEMEGPGIINHIWMTQTGSWRWTVLRIYWDDETEPSVECPVADFYCMGWEQYEPISSAAICVNPAKAFNSYWQMPFRRKCRITVENLDDSDITMFYQVDYTLTKVPSDAAYFHAKWHRERFCESGIFTILDGVKGKGQYVGVYLAYGVHNSGWWGEGEVKMYIDGDKDYPTICGTGLEDYICGSYDWEIGGQYYTYCTPYAGLCQVIRPDGTYQSQQRFGMYRWHILDPVRFKKDLKITVQDLGWRSGGRFTKQHSDISATAFWYQTEPHVPFGPFASKDDLENL